MADVETQLSDTEEVGDLHQFGYAQSLRRTMSPFASFAVAFSMVSITTAIFFLLPSLFGTSGAVGSGCGYPAPPGCSSSCSSTRTLRPAFPSPASPTSGTAA